VRGDPVREVEPPGHDHDGRRETQGDDREVHGGTRVEKCRLFYAGVAAESAAEEQTAAEPERHGAGEEVGFEGVQPVGEPSGDEVEGGGLGGQVEEERVVSEHQYERQRQRQRQEQEGDEGVGVSEAVLGSSQGEASERVEGRGGERDPT